MTVKTDILYNRQKKIKLRYPKSITVVGIGGVGSWLAFNLALSGIEKLILIDHDIVEEHNLNRTPFRLCDINRRKVDAISQIILERRKVELLPIASKAEDIGIELKSSILCDCRDTTSPLPKMLKGSLSIIGGYDGSSITLHTKPNPRTVWGDEPAPYTITPSWLIPAQLIANIITSYIMDYSPEKKEIVKTFTVNSLLKNILNGKEAKGNGKARKTQKLRGRR